MNACPSALTLAGACLASISVVGLPAAGARTLALALADIWASPLDDAPAKVSAKGTHVAFTSHATLSQDDDAPVADIYVMDLESGAVTLESDGAGGRTSNGDSTAPDISADGRWLVFSSVSDVLVVPRTAGKSRQVYLRDRARGETVRVTATPTGTGLDRDSGDAVISADASTIVFQSAATDFVSANGVSNPMDVYLLRRGTGARERVSVATDGAGRRGQSTSPEVSGDGRYVTFTSHADLTTPPEIPDLNGRPDVYLRDTVARTTRRISVALRARDTDGGSYFPTISGDGRFITFVSEATNLTADRGPRVAHIYMHDAASGRTERISMANSGDAADARSTRPRISADGSVIVFQSLASNLGCDGRCRDGERDTNLMWDVFRYDRTSRRTTRLTADDSGGWALGGRAAAVSDNGTVVIFASRHPRNEDDLADDEDLFVRILPGDVLTRAAGFRHR